jgi:3-deoxy-7-phosphoheptulonate synthase
MRQTQNLNVLSIVPIVPPRVIQSEVPLTLDSVDTVVAGREGVGRILRGEDKRFLVVVGPCSIHDEPAAFDYAARLRELSDKVSDRLMVVMRVYFEKPRTTVGWKGLINDPHLDGTFDMNAGLRRARAILVKINEAGLPAGTEMLDPITPQYMADLVSWASIGARTTESQTHRQMASGLSMPIGFKNGTDGSIQTAVDAMVAARNRHTFLGVDDNGAACVVHTKGNPLGHIILRGGRSGPNYDEESIAETTEMMEKAGLAPRIMVDCSHANSSKDYARQEIVCRDVVRQVRAGNRALVGVMLESNLCEGNQKLSDDPQKLRYGVSITDPCIGWEKTEELLRFMHDALAPHAVA